MYTLVCQECSTSFVAHRCDAKFCHPRCRQRQFIRHKRFNAKRRVILDEKAGLEAYWEALLTQQQNLEQRLVTLYQNIHACKDTIRQFPTQFRQLQQQHREELERNIPKSRYEDDQSLHNVLREVVVSTAQSTKSEAMRILRQQRNESHSQLPQLKAQIQVIRQKLYEQQQQLDECQHNLSRVEEQLQQPPPAPRQLATATPTLNITDPVQSSAPTTPSRPALSFEGAADLAQKSFTTITFPGALGQFIGQLDRYKTAFALTGDPGAGKSYFVCALARLFEQQGLKVAFFQLEMGRGEIFSRMCRHYQLTNRVKISDSATLEDVHQVAARFDCIIIDSFTKLSDQQQDFDALVQRFPKVIFVAIFQKTAQGTIRGGSRIAFDSAAVINVTKQNGKRVAVMQKSQYGTIGWQYDTQQDQLLDL